MGTISAILRSSGKLPCSTHELNRLHIKEYIAVFQKFSVNIIYPGSSFDF